MLTKRHMVALAAIVRRAGERTISHDLHVMTADQRQWLAEELGNFLASENPRFDRGRFLDACDLEGR